MVLIFVPDSCTDNDGGRLQGLESDWTQRWTPFAGDGVFDRQVNGIDGPASYLVVYPTLHWDVHHNDPVGLSRLGWQTDHQKQDPDSDCAHDFGAAVQRDSLARGSKQLEHGIYLL